MIFSRGRMAFICTSFATVLLVVGSSLLAASNSKEDDAVDSPYKYLSVFMEVFGLSTRAYVDEPKKEMLLAGAFEGSLDALDPFSLYVPGEAYGTYLETLKIGNRRSGLTLLKERGVAYVVAVEPGSPAAKLDLQTGDILADIGGSRTRETPLFELHRLLAQPPGTKLKIERLRLGQKATVELELAEFERAPVLLEEKRGLPLLRIPSFGVGTEASVATSLKTVVGGSEHLPSLSAKDKLLVDLRGVAGGDERVAFKVAGLLVAGDLGALMKRSEKVETYESQAAALFSGQIVVLVDRGTQGAAEVLATVLRQRAAAKLVGENSFGHAGTSEWLALSDGARLLLTTAFFTGPDKEPIKEGLEPDERVRPFLTEETDAKVDQVLERGLDLLLGTPEAPAPTPA